MATRLENVSKKIFTGFSVDGLHVRDELELRHAFVCSSLAVFVMLFAVGKHWMFLRESEMKSTSEAGSTSPRATAYSM